MARYIDADEVKKAIEESWDGCLGSYDSNEIVVNDLWVIDKVPTADVVEVVRCKDCKHLEILNGKSVFARCNRHNFPFISFGNADTRTWFCADGERRAE